MGDLRQFASVQLRLFVDLAVYRFVAPQWREEAPTDVGPFRLPREKAKGKQRVVELSDAPESSGQREPLAKPLVIRFTEGIQDLSLQVEHKDTVRDVKRKIRDAQPTLQDRRLRLIHSGRLLSDQTQLYEWLEALEERQRQAASHDQSATISTPVSTNTIWLHCSVGPKIEPGEEDETGVQTAQLKPLRGFDRLVAAGFSEQDIANIRSEFHAHSSGDYLDQDFANDEEYDEHIRTLEEQWIDSMDTHTESMSQSSTRTAILNGIIIGFFFPILPFFFLHEVKPAVFWEDGTDHNVSSRTIFSRRTNMGVVIGVAMNILFGLWTYLLTS